MKVKKNYFKCFTRNCLITNSNDYFFLMILQSIYFRLFYSKSLNYHEFLFKSQFKLNNGIFLFLKDFAKYSISILKIYGNQ